MSNECRHLHSKIRLSESPLLEGGKAHGKEVE